MTRSIPSTEEAKVSRTDVLDLLGMSLLAVFAFAVWPPLCLLVAGIAALVMSWASDRGSE